MEPYNMERIQGMVRPRDSIFSNEDDLFLSDDFNRGTSVAAMSIPATTTATAANNSFDFSKILNDSFIDDESFLEGSPQEKSFIESNDQMKKSRLNGTTPIKPPATSFSFFLFF